MEIYNTLTGKTGEFLPLNDKKVAMYVCGVTPYDEAHLGHARAYVTFDIIRRHLAQSGYEVKHVQNFTDIDDKLIRRAGELNLTVRELADRNIGDYFTQMDKLNITRANLYPRVTENIPEIIAFIRNLVDKGFAYPKEGDVYFSVRKFPGYGRLSGRSVDELRAGTRIETGENKNEPEDFALWKKSKPEESAEISWESPWGKGRPGWHIECSVMAGRFLGETIDIHGGGQDLIFPHHENEIAQSESANGKQFVRYWIHNGFVTVNREKMSKSLGNFFTLRSIFEKFPPRIVRYFLLTQHYRQPLDFSDDKLVQAQTALGGLDDAYLKLLDTLEAAPAGAAPEDESTSGTLNRFRKALDEDFNTEKSLAVLHEFKKEILSTLHSAPAGLRMAQAKTFTLILEGHLGITPPRPAEFPPEIIELKGQREQARRQKQWALADSLRIRLEQAGYQALDNPDGTSTLLRKKS
ncbi:MAG: cysteine--tRNA ligase [Elusimicrobia bacterium RIFOXYA2_FULL_50_26]|nr:MAG: cysteine--tRNA ligase [Elusimicrobia bacterium RIFOXYA2_FULL_50_26]OGS23711.1 MAG: cysteine--tRNA ligase [Elusimicrobia bacterium RIFOXYB2_FULL_50_12]